MVPRFIAALRTRRKITFVLADRASLGGNYGLTDLDEAVVFLDESNTLGEMRSTIAHELTHLTYPTSSEEEVEAMAAEMLVPLADALEAHARNAIEETAERLMVDGRLILARIRAAGGGLPPSPELAV
jgi:Zn-dependent peptidase ImmA (M78 family)